MTIKTDNGSEFISKVMDKWAYERGIELDFCRLGKPTDNAMVESFNGRLRQECLNEHWFMSLQDARTKIEARRSFYRATVNFFGWLPKKHCFLAHWIAGRLQASAWGSSACVA
jgi:hypothetical protein